MKLKVEKKAGTFNVGVFRQTDKIFVSLGNDP